MYWVRHQTGRAAEFARRNSPLTCGSVARETTACPSAGAYGLDCVERALMRFIPLGKSIRFRVQARPTVFAPLWVITTSEVQRMRRSESVEIEVRA